MKKHAIVIMLLLSIASSGNAQQKDEAVERAREYEPLILAVAIKRHLDPRLLWTIAWLETRFRHYDERGRIITSPAGAKGIMQIMPSTAARYGWLNERDQIQAIDAAACYLSDLQELFGGRLDLILAAYNAGEGAVETFRAGRPLALPNGKVLNPKGVQSPIPPYRETIAYVRNGLNVFSRLSKADYFSPEHIANLRNIEAPTSNESSITQIPVELEEMPVEIRKGSVYADDFSSTDIFNTPTYPPMPNLPKTSKSQSVYAR